MGVDNSLNKWDLKVSKIVNKFTDFYTYDFDSAFDVDLSGRSLVGQINKCGTKFQRRISAKTRFYTFCKFQNSIGHTSAICSSTNRVFFGLGNSKILVKSLETHKCIFQIKRAHNESRVNTLALDKKGLYLFSGGSDRNLFIFDAKQRHFPLLKKFNFEFEVIHLRFSNTQKYISVGCFGNSDKNFLKIIDTGTLFEEKK